MSTYIDTSALAKWYFPEAGSEAFETWYRDAASTWTTSLLILEMHSLVARRIREKLLLASDGRLVVAQIAADAARGLITVRALTDDVVVASQSIFAALPKSPIRTLDALHLGAAQSGGAAELATADAVMADAAAALGFTVRFFGAKRPIRRR